jgi:hypothetical protein
MGGGHFWKESTGSSWHQSNDIYGREGTGKPEARILESKGRRRGSRGEESQQVSFQSRRGPTLAADFNF